MKYIDSHSHLYFPQFDADREEVYARMRDSQVQTIAIGTGFLTSRQAVQMVSDVPDLVLAATVGVHPNSATEGFDAALFEGLFVPKGESEGAPLLVCGVGECGLDYFRGADETEKKRQQEVFEAQIAFAVQYDLPLMLHVRSSPGTSDAHQDAFALLKKAQGTHGERVRGTAHFFTASLEIAKGYWGMGFATSFPGVITFAKETEEVVRLAPRDLMLAETDAPYAAPVPHRGKRNEPAFVVDVVEHIARVRGEDPESVAAAILENTQRIFLTV